MSRRLCRALIFSFILHAALLMAFLFHMPPTPPATPKIVQFEYREPPKTAAPKAGNKGRGSPAKHGKGGIQLGDLVPRMAIDMRALHGQNFKDEGQQSAGEDDWGSHGGDFGEIQYFSQYDRLFREIEGLLNYPGRLGEHDIAGTVNARLTFDAQSHCDWQRTHVNGAHPYLRYYTVALLKRLCAFETIEHIRFKPGQFVDLSFAFAIVTEASSQPGQDMRDRVTGNVLTFYRDYHKSVLDYHIGPIRGLLFVPAIGLDTQWLIEHWEKWVDGKDPLREFQGHGEDPGM